MSTWRYIRKAAEKATTEGRTHVTVQTVALACLLEDVDGLVKRYEKVAAALAALRPPDPTCTCPLGGTEHRPWCPVLAPGNTAGGAS